MEVHAHSHTPRKKWTHYFWEFLMLFLAVFCGFLAENLREHKVENKKEKEYIRSLLSDLKEDTINISTSIDGNIIKVHGLDTLTTLLNSGDISDTIYSKLYRLNRLYASNINTSSISERTIRQLLSSGNMRLIHRQKVSDSIMQYYGRIKEDLIGQERIYEEAMKRVVFYGEDIFDNFYQKLKLTSDTAFFRERQPDFTKLLTTENKILKKYTSMLITASGMSAYYLSMLLEMRNKAIGLIDFLKKEYHLEDS